MGPPVLLLATSSSKPRATVRTAGSPSAPRTLNAVVTLAISISSSMQGMPMPPECGGAYSEALAVLRGSLKAVLTAFFTSFSTFCAHVLFESVFCRMKVRAGFAKRCNTSVAFLLVRMNSRECRSKWISDTRRKRHKTRYHQTRITRDHVHMLSIRMVNILQPSFFRFKFSHNH